MSHTHPTDAASAILDDSHITGIRKRTMAKKKTEKALKAIEKDVKKALRKGATEAGVGDAVDRAIKKAAKKGPPKKLKSRRPDTKPSKPVVD